MKTHFKKTKTFSNALVIVLAFSLLLLFSPMVFAHDPAWEIPTYAFVNAVPNPVGTGQPVTITMWLNLVPPTSYTIYGDRWEGFEVTVRKPNGTTLTLGPFTSDNVGSAWTQFVPDTVGTYYLTFNFPGQTLAGNNPPPFPFNAQWIGDYYLPSSSPEVELIVQEDPIEAYPETPLPEEYWQRPIYGMNSNWKSIAGDWLYQGYDSMGIGRFPNTNTNMYTTAPESAHIVWSYPVVFGGVAGTGYQDWNYYTGLAYEQKFNQPVLMHGRLYFNLPLSTGISIFDESGGFAGCVCIDLRTGEELWVQEDTRIALGQNLDYNSPNQFGIIPYLWHLGSTYECYDPKTGEWLFSLENATSGTFTYGPNGELLVYILNSRNNWLAMWNSTKAIVPYHSNPWEWRPLNVVKMDWNNGVQWNVTTQPYSGDGGSSLAISRVTSEVILATTGSIVAGQNWQMEVGYSAKSGQELWAQNRSTPIGATTWALMGPVSEDVYTEFHESKMSWYGFNIHTGQQIWGPTEPYPRAFGMYSWVASISDGKLFTADFGGYLHAFDVNTGEELWSFFTGSSGLETPYGAWPPNSPPPVYADGKVYFVVGHAYNPPLFKGARIYCVDASDGTLIWSELGFYTYDPVEVADGFLVTYNCYDGQVYCYGKGQSATTVFVQDDVVPIGESVLIKGTVTDLSPGKTCLGVPAAGTPAVADECMSEWMAYLYMQQPCPENAAGVEVVISTFDPNGNTYELGRTTTSSSGTFGCVVNPPVPGLYKIIATFEGSNSYYASYAETYLNVEEASSPGQQFETELAEATQVTGTLFIATEFILILAVVIIAVIALAGFYIFRKLK